MRCSKCATKFKAKAKQVKQGKFPCPKCKTLTSQQGESQ